MGIIKDGSISGVLPSSNEVFAVHYPGYPSSIERAVETLGGNEGILKVRTNKSNLELRFRPEDPYSHPVFGRLQPCNNFLLKISKRKVKDEENTEDLNSISGQGSENSPHAMRNVPASTETSQQISQHQGESPPASLESEAPTPSRTQEQLSADIVAHLSESYYFNGMVDYQHVLPVHADTYRRKKRNWAEVEPQLEKGGLIDVDQEDLMIIVPPLFTNKDHPKTLVFKDPVEANIKKKPEGVVQKQRWEMEIERCLGIDFKIKEIPKKVNWEKSIPRDSDEWKWQMAVCELFDERPIWIKNALVERLLDEDLSFRDKKLQRFLFIAAYYFSNGPFHRFYIRKGYDPRRDPESRIYQRTDFRVPPSLRSYCDKCIASGLTNRWEDVCAFRVFPFKCQTSLQLFELKDDYIQEEIRKPCTQKSCHPKTGWFSSRVIDSLRLRVSQRFLSAYPEAGAESLLRYASRRFEKSRKVLISVKDSKAGEEKPDDKEVSDEEGEDPNNEIEDEEDREVSDGEHKEANNDIEDEEEEEDEMEDDNLEEDMDADEELDLADQDTEFPDSHIENTSKDYLQELFSSFPFSTVGGDETQDADPFDEEYEIYEQYSDGKYSDDED